MSKETIVIIGKNGKTGVRVEQRLQQQGYTTRGVSRSTTPAFDWTAPETWAEALSGATSAYVTFQPDLAVPGAEQTIREFVAVAKTSGIQHIVLLSGRGETGAQRAERLVQASGLTWNIVRASWFMQNFSESFMLEGIMNDALVLPAANTPEPFADADDIAEVAVAAFTRPELHNRLFEVTGPQAITFAECVAQLSEALGRKIQYLPVPLSTYLEGMKEQGFSEDYLWLINELFSVVFDGRNTPVAHGVEEALGRPATSFSDYVQKTRASGVWDRTETKLA